MTARSSRQCCHCLKSISAEAREGLWLGGRHTWKDAVASCLSVLVEGVLVDDGICGNSVLGPGDLGVVFGCNVCMLYLHCVDATPLGPGVAGFRQYMTLGKLGASILTLASLAQTQTSAGCCSAP